MYHIILRSTSTIRRAECALLVLCWCFPLLSGSAASVRPHQGRGTGITVGWCRMARSTVERPNRHPGHILQGSRESRWGWRQENAGTLGNEQGTSTRMEATRATPVPKGTRKLSSPAAVAADVGSKRLGGRGSTLLTIGTLASWETIVPDMTKPDQDARDQKTVCFTRMEVARLLYQVKSRLLRSTLSPNYVQCLSAADPRKWVALIRKERKERKREKKSPHNVPLLWSKRLVFRGLWGEGQPIQIRWPLKRPTRIQQLKKHMWRV